MPSSRTVPTMEDIYKSLPPLAQSSMHELKEIGNLEKRPTYNYDRSRIITSAIYFHGRMRVGCNLPNILPVHSIRHESLLECCKDMVIHNLYLH